MKKIIAVFLVVVIICFSSCNSKRNPENIDKQNTKISQNKNATAGDNVDNVSVKNHFNNPVKNPITDKNNPAYYLGKEIIAVESCFNTEFVLQDDGTYWNSGIGVIPDISSGYIVELMIDLWSCENQEFMKLKYGMSYNEVSSILEQYGYSVKTDEGGFGVANLYFYENNDFYTGLCTFDNIDDSLQTVNFYVNSSEISTWVASSDILYNVLDGFTVIDETTDGVDSEGYPIVVETVYANQDESVQIYFDMYSALTKIVVMDNPNYFVFGVKTGMSLNNARQALSYDFKSVGENVFKDNRGCVVKLLVEKNIVKGISLSFEY